MILSHGACHGEVEGKGGAQMCGYWAGHVVRLEGISLILYIGKLFHYFR